MLRFLMVCCVLFSKTVFSLDLELTQGINAALPIGINSFGYSSEAQNLKDVIDSDLKLSGQFRLINAPRSSSNVAAWKSLGADSVLTGQVSPASGGRYTVHFELADAAAHGRLLLAKDYTVSAQQMRALAHHISDEVYEKLIGERGIFSTHIAYIVVQRMSAGTRYFLEVAEVDGSNPQRLLVSTDPIMSPSWSPDGRQIAYVSFEKKRAQIFTVTVATGQRRLLTDFPGINGAPAWSPDGRQLAVVLSKGGNPKIYSIDLSSGAMKQLTFGDAIDTEPRFSPDGGSLLFTSGRGGSPQIYSLTLANGQVTRITYDGNYNARASYTPNKQNIVMLHRENGSFNIGVQDLVRGGILPLTSSPMDESPSVAPNGRLVVYATRYQDKGMLGLVSLDGRVRLRLPPRDGDIQEPTWSPFLG
ncbi:MAG: Tol-Pal system beta propeller repeat protein TolB [Legionellaceae bacterium]